MSSEYPYKFFSAKDLKWTAVFDNSGVSNRGGTVDLNASLIRMWIPTPPTGYGILGTFASAVDPSTLDTKIPLIRTDSSAAIKYTPYTGIWTWDSRTKDNSAPYPAKNTIMIRPKGATDTAVSVSDIPIGFPGSDTGRLVNVPAENKIMGVASGTLPFTSEAKNSYLNNVYLVDKRYVAVSSSPWAKTEVVFRPDDSGSHYRSEAQMFSPQPGLLRSVSSHGVETGWSGQHDKLSANSWKYLPATPKYIIPSSLADCCMGRGGNCPEETKTPGFCDQFMTEMCAKEKGSDLAVCGCINRPAGKSGEQLHPTLSASCSQDTYLTNAIKILMAAPFNYQYCGIASDLMSQGQGNKIGQVAYANQCTQNTTTNTTTAGEPTKTTTTNTTTPGELTGTGAGSAASQPAGTAPAGTGYVPPPVVTDNTMLYYAIGGVSVIVLLLLIFVLVK